MDIRLLANGGELSTVQLMLGHAELERADPYSKVSYARLCQVFAEVL